MNHLPRVLLEPLGRNRLFDERGRFAPDDRLYPWLVRLRLASSQGITLVHPKLQVSNTQGSVYVHGTLLFHQLRSWITHLANDHTRELGQILRETLDCHLTENEGLIWHRFGERQHLDFSQPRLMGIINVTPDSFSDGGLYLKAEDAIQHGMEMIEAGAGILDIGGESTRPGSQPVTLVEELNRVVPVIKGIRQQSGVPISIDSSKAQVVQAALEAGADIVNDVTALRGDPEMVNLMAQNDNPLILMHMHGTPATMQKDPQYDCVVEEVYEFLQQRIKYCEEHGISRGRLIVDPGVGFGKTTQHNLHLMRHMATFQGLGTTVKIGLSRKRTVGELTGVDTPSERDPGSHLLGGLCALSGTEIIRVHDVAGAKQSISIINRWITG